MRILRNYSKSPLSPNGLCILSAVRTPIGLVNGVLSEFTAPQLGSFAIKEALQRAAVPPGDVENVFLGCASHNDCDEEIIKRTNLSKDAKVSVFMSGMNYFSEAVKFLLNNNGKVCVAGGMESVTRSTDSQSYTSFIKSVQDDTKLLVKSNIVNLNDRMKFVEDHNNFVEGNRSGAFYEEIVKIDFRKKGHQIFVVEDEVLRMNDLQEGDLVTPPTGDGASAIILSTRDYSKRNGLVSLAEVLSYAEEVVDASDLTSAQCLAIEKALKGAQYKCEDMVRWEMDSIVSDSIIKCKACLNINSSQVNKDGGILSLGYPTGMSGSRAVCHLVHSLSAGELGCAVSCDFRTASAVVVKKLAFRKSSKPQLTLYTKHPCPLCDELKHQLKPFEGRFSIAEVDIEGREREKYKELYQYEIPVLFLDGIFLCKHRLDVEHFKRRLLASEGEPA